MAIRVEPQTWYTTEELAEMRGVSRQTLERERSQGGGVPFRRLGKRCFYKGAEILDHLEKGMVENTEQEKQLCAA